MYLESLKLRELCNIAKSAALEAGKIIASNHGQEVEVNNKEGGENIASCVVTEIDLRAQRAILNILTPTLKPFELGLLTEESVDDNSRFSHDYFWCIDPLDGTLCYSKGEDGYSVSIALISREGSPVIGVVYNPRSNTLYHAIKGEGAFKNDLPLSVERNSQTLTLLYDQSYLKHPDFNQQIESLKKELQKLGLNELKIFHLGGAVMNGISTIDLAPAIYFKFPKESLGGGSLWDFAASSIIQSEAGGFNSNYHKEALDLNRKDSTFMNHEGVIYCSTKELLLIIP
ncbi:3'(2'),5'-bisphosphate nucleotidase CysQ [Halobacteriovorax sp. HLS]|uniref:3'(2'),5'-bisphosphate nucleotidase CysQ family protein n=1 Tax=Halobacteriovorax sp. HLS TaxID=2234000 RepID=UPI000FD9BE4E|nr:inositol monophosphatase family protein [Halobacteriovorax sp. HLS]